jgi:ADP-ribose pyrophosphatase YjhB (NUDIX family)
MENIISVSVLVSRKDDILFVKSIQPNGIIKLMLPGGRLKDNENIEQCAVREVKEAAGIEVILDKKLSGVIMRKNKQGNNLITFTFFAEAVGRGETERTIYLPYDNAENYSDISEFSRFIIRKLKSSSLSGLDGSEHNKLGERDYLVYF